MIKLKDILLEGKVYFDIYRNNRGSEADVYENGDLGKKPRGGYYVEVYNSYDMKFKNKAELDKWLKKKNYRHIGVDKEYFQGNKMIKLKEILNEKTGGAKTYKSLIKLETGIKDLEKTFQRDERDMQRDRASKIKKHIGDIKRSWSAIWADFQGQ